MLTAKSSGSSQSQSSLAKRKKQEDDTLQANKKQRTRVSFSCGECHRRKQKCDRQVPCSHCIARRVPELCKAYTPGKADHDVNARIARLEQIIENALPQFWAGNSMQHDANGSVQRSSPSIAEDDNRSQPDEQDPSGGTFQSGKWYGNSASGSVAPGPVLEQLLHVPSLVDGETVGDDLRGLNGQALTQKPPLTSIEEDLEPSAADNLKSLVQECGVSPHKISELLQELPPLRVSDVLVNYYFTSINWTRYPLDEKEFRAAYSSICAHGRDGIGATNPNDVRFLPLLFVVLAISARLSPETVGGDARTRRITSLRYYWSSRRSLLIAAAIQPDSLDIVLTRLLSARFLTFDRRITECWSQLGAAVRTAQALGLHRDGSNMGMDPCRVEYRRRIWSYLYHADRSYALVLGRPNSIQDDYTSTKMPSNIDDASKQTSAYESPPLSTPTPMTFVILRHQLSAITGRIVHHFQQVRERSHYSDVLALDDEVLKFITNLPPHYGLAPDTSLDETHPFVAIHRFLLLTEILFVRTGLHRPYLLKRLNSERYARSRIACFESAIKDYEIRQAFRDSVSKETQDSLSNAYREFQTAMISGLYFILEPKGKYSEQMHAILDGFMKDHEGTHELDETTRRELKTIEFLKAKASQVESFTETHRSTLADPTKPEQQAQLLLSLQKSGSSAKTYPSLLNIGTQDQPLAISNLNQHLTQSPTFHRLQQSQDYVNSPTTSNSPHGDDENAAQSLLDHWCNTISNAPMDASTGSTPWVGTGGEFPAWLGSTNSTVVPDLRSLAVLEGSDWSYWETLVNQIQRVGP
ncbi:transcriptional regulator family: Fungal Specific TF [Agaricus bisporus var. burnettii]|uniref:Transcriptional regulator family: Fungal Specific TF n=1 Tax=Agaricus bisporus var. burnettii TaxID=192524 RepID=A0A8H7KH75_AGABI|nr:transcriptional regulator family: Fungal Specific TF [Agaricus bisporus var. burnettii]